MKQKRKTLFRENELKQAAIIEQQKNYTLLARQNGLMDSIVQSEQAYNTLLVSENNLKNSQLQNETKLKAALSRENDLKTSQLIKEQNTRFGLAVGIGILLLAGVSIFTLYRKQKQKTASFKNKQLI
ncbi:MAG: hypothetical protein IPP48_09100 [Chitinophagaceae bacterium]|nr:hypothetical protein [Chitinophagaceae bacterium]